jgi:hypothetical protein
MGEIADDMVAGHSCSYCGIYFEDEHGFPVICRGCFRTWQRENRKGKKKFTQMTGLQVATIKELSG